MAVSNDPLDPDSLPPFPVLMEEPAERWRWPALPFDWRHVAPPDAGVAQPCRVETPTGSIVEGELTGIDAPAGSLSLRTAAGGPVLTLPFARFRRLTLTTPLRALPQRGDIAAERVPAAAQQRDYRLLAANGEAVLSGRTVGHVERDEGLYLFAPSDDERSLLRMFVPRAAYSGSEFGPTAQDLAAERWIATPRELLEAIERQRRMPVLPIGQSLLDLGLVTPEQLSRALAEPAGETPLGERLVASGVISRADLQTTIAHKMGYPFVDLTRFPVDPAAARKLPLRMAVAHRALPLMLDQDRLIVAVDRPSRVTKLQALYALAGFTVVPVLASKGQILLALSGLSQGDTWSDNVSIRAEFFSTSR